jgi:hypothetical protein
MEAGCAVTHPEIERLNGAITGALAGIAAQAIFNPSSIHSNSGDCDYLHARQLIDELNALGVQLPMSYEGAAKRAIQFCQDNWAAIENLVLVLAPIGTLCHQDVQLFSGLPSWRLLPA